MVPMLALSDVVMSVEWLLLPLLSCSGRVSICEELEPRRTQEFCGGNIDIFYNENIEICVHPVAAGERFQQLSARNSAKSSPYASCTSYASCRFGAMG